tara:strand:- start:6418 stop:6921 length:504 start_codon:yes stop_codon:yes gene_type:complete
MKILLTICILVNLYSICFCFKPILSLNNELNKNTKLRKNNVDRNIYAKYLKDIRKTQKFISKSSKTLNVYNNNNNYTNINENSEIYYNNSDLKFKNLIIKDNIYINIENIRRINIIAENGELIIELDKKKPNDIINISKNIENIDKLMNIDKLINIINLLIYLNENK